MIRPRRAPFALSLALVLGCKSPPSAQPDASPAPTASDSSTPSSPSMEPPPSATPDASTPDATTKDAAPGDAAAATLPGDAGASACKLVYGPAQQSWRGPAALHAGKDDVDVVFNEDGAPRTLHVAGGPIDPNAKPKQLAASGTTATAMGSPCAFG